jgi:hypothetical protein
MDRSEVALEYFNHGAGAKYSLVSNYGNNFTDVA